MDGNQIYAKSDSKNKKILWRSNLLCKDYVIFIWVNYHINCKDDHDGEDLYLVWQFSRVRRHLPLLNQPINECQLHEAQHLYSAGSEHILLDYSQHLFGIFLLPSKTTRNKHRSLSNSNRQWRYRTQEKQWEAIE